MLVLGDEDRKWAILSNLLMDSVPLCNLLDFTWLILMLERANTPIFLGLQSELFFPDGNNVYITNVCI